MSLWVRGYGRGVVGGAQVSCSPRPVAKGEGGMAALRSQTSRPPPWLTVTSARRVGSGKAEEIFTAEKHKMTSSRHGEKKTHKERQRKKK